ncbi:hypothetical protein [uncultured Psychroserpens sp.]|uniref:hypothetical protein n=1 Tax=uncultured Psychroserpens sp. TaxID=255436 RepID=UPI00263019C1|nr:hypothetical protein [uncultured Psychroserpens sp.]
MRSLLKGSVKFTEIYEYWSMEINLTWTKHWIKIHVTSRAQHLKTDFISCKLSQAYFLGLFLKGVSYGIGLGRADNSASLKFSGRKSEYSDIILESAATQYLLDSRNASIELDKKCLIFKGSVRKKDQISLSNIFILIEMLMEEIDDLTVTSNHS